MFKCKIQLDFEQKWFNQTSTNILYFINLSKFFFRCLKLFSPTFGVKENEINEIHETASK